MKKYDRMWIGLIGGLVLPLLIFFIYFSIRDPKLHFADQINRQVESNTLMYHISMCALINLILFFNFLRVNAELAARGVLIATLVYVFTIMLLLFI